ncbi:MAG TPA: ABC transporter permease [Candidatus Angelobacter sp.]|nr:ABC transporter permease [Candidatus Angelobacter sp.]
MESFLQDLRYGFRMIFRSPGFSAIAILTLALGIGANTAIFSVVNGVLLNALPFRDGDQLVSLFEQIPNFDNASISYPNFSDWRRMNHSFTAIAAYRSDGVDLTGLGVPEHLHGEMISAGFFEILGVNPLMGRTFSADEDRLGANPTVMISESLWRRRFGAARDIVGRHLVLNGESRAVIGVVPTSFHLHIQNFQRGAPLIDVFTPVGEYNEPHFYNERGSGWGMDAIGRLKPGVTLEQARQDMDRVSAQLTAAYPDIDSGRKARVITLKDEMVGDIRPFLILLLVAVIFVLLISCVNVANLLLARSTVRQHEFAVRIALGAAQPRLIRQLLTESVLLSLIGGALGLVLAKFGTAAAIAARPRGMPRMEEIGLDVRVLLFTVAISVLAGIVFGLAPAWKTARADVGGTLKESGRTLAGRRSRAQSVFVVAEMAIALVLLVGAGLMVRTLFRLWGLNTGFDPHNVMTFEISGPESSKSQPADAIRAAYRQIHEKIASTPGVETVAFNAGARPMENDDEEFIWFVGRPKPAHQSDLALALKYVVEPDYFQVMHIQLKRGRFFNAADSEHAAAVALIDERLAEKYFPGQDPIGQYIDMNNNTNEADKIPNPQIIGIVGHVNQWGLDADASSPMQAQMYVPFAQIPDKYLQRFGVGSPVVVRTQRHGAPDFESLRKRILEYNGELIPFAPEDVEQVVAGSVADKRFTMTLLAVFAGLALLLAAIGIYGVLSYLVGQRVQEIGIRMALGARRWDVLRLILRDGARMTLTGVVIGVVAALGLTRLMSSLLFGVSATDPLTFIAVTGILCLIALLACYIPARRAMQVDPIVALRYE